jgi:Holliday junction resolvase RusA-like endonuclease
MELAFVVLGPPKPWQRAVPGAAPGRCHKTKATRAYQKLIGTIAGLHRPPKWPLDALYEVTFVAYCTDDRVRDIDNIKKNLLDGLKRVLFQDDHQVVGGEQGKDIDLQHPRLEVLVKVLTRDHAKQANQRRAHAIEVVRKQAKASSGTHLPAA